MPEHVVRKVTVEVEIEIRGAESPGAAADNALRLMDLPSTTDIKINSILVRRQ
jgi:hypothetical protein